ncbi:MAG: hypothetical protein MJ240_08980 [Kiritimatiellae bacterium]|nr:hypothetical protein [Kiritimatiellia bacterium]
MDETKKNENLLPEKPEEGKAVTIASFIDNYRNTHDVIKKMKGVSNYRGMAKSLGEVYGIKCVKPGNFGDGSLDYNGEFELHTSLGEFKIKVGWCFAELGLFVLELGDGLEIAYTDVRLVVAMGLLKMCHWDCDYDAYRLGDERHGCFAVNCGFDAGSWIELRGMSEEWAWKVAYRMGFPSCLDRFEHFCRDFVWIDEKGCLITDRYEIMNCNSTLLRMNECCLRHYEFESGDCTVGWHLVENAIALGSAKKGVRQSDR